MTMSAPIALLLLVLAPSAQAAERRLTVTDFDRVRIEGPFAVTLKTGRSPSAVMTGDQRALDRVQVSVEGRLLRVRPNKSAWGGFAGERGSDAPLTISLTTHGLRGAYVAGAGKLTVDKVKALKFELAVTGSGAAELSQADVDNLNLGLVGSGRLLIGGNAKTMRATLQGSGNLQAEALTVEDARLNTDSAGSVRLGVKRAATIVASGPGDIEIIGSPACTVKATGAGRVICGDE